MVSFHNIRSILFDLDGTLIDSFNAFSRIANETCQSLGLPIVEKKYHLDVVNKGASFLDYCIPRDISDEKKENLINKFKQESNKIKFDIFSEEIKLFGDVIPVLEKLKQQGYFLGIVTSSQKSMFCIPQVKPLLTYMDTIVTRESVATLKPNPEPIYTAIKQLNTSVEDTILIGDTPLDIKAGKQARIPTVGVLTGTSDYDCLENCGADYVFATLSDIHGLLKANELRPKDSPIFQGMYTRGEHEASSFLAIDWVKKSLEKTVQIKPFPGTFNLKLIHSSIKKFENFLEQHQSLQIPLPVQKGFCDATLYPTTIHTSYGSLTNYILKPQVPEYDKEKVEFISSIKIVERLNIKKCQPVFFTIGEKS